MSENSRTDRRQWRFTAPDGVALAIHEMGAEDGRPAILIHGLFSDAETNWIKYGHAALLAERGFRVIMPDLRGHGESDRPHAAAAYPPDVLADDALALIAQLGFAAYDLGGYSLGGRTVMRALVRGAAPRRAIIAGMGLNGLTDTARRGDHFRHVLQGLGTHQRGSEAWMAEQFLKTTGADPQALLPLLDSFVDTGADAVAAVATPVLVVSGAEDSDNGSAEALADVMPDARSVEVPGNHMSAVTKRELGTAIADFLTA